MEQGQKISLKELLSHLIIPATTAQPLVSTLPRHARGKKIHHGTGTVPPTRSRDAVSPIVGSTCLGYSFVVLPPIIWLACPYTSRSPKQAFFVNIWCHLYRTNSPAVRAPVSWQALRLAVQGSGCVSFHKSIIRRLDGTGLLFNRVEIERNEDRMHCCCSSRVCSSVRPASLVQ